MMLHRVLAIAFFVAIPVVFAAQAGKPEGVELAPVVKAVNDALTDAQSKNVKGFPELKKAVLELSSTVTKEGEAKFKFLIFSIGGSKGSDAGVTLSLEMTVPSTSGAIEPSSVNPMDLKYALARAINQAKVAWVQANQQAIGKLKPTTIDVEVKFAIRKSASGGVDTAELLPVGLELTGKIAREETHSVKLTFGK